MAPSFYPPTPPTELAEPHETTTTTTTSTHSSVKKFTMSAIGATNTTIMALPPNKQKHIWVLTGPAGCGKTSVAQCLHSTYGFPYLEGDSYHTPENVEKMAHGHALTDGDRWDWLIRLRETALAVLHGDKSVIIPSSNSADATPPIDSNPTPSRTTESTQTQRSSSSSLPAFALASNVIVTCSALKRKYRDVIRLATLEESVTAVHFLFLAVGEGPLLERVHARQGHYMKEDMVRSQILSLETPNPEEELDVSIVDADHAPQDVCLAAAKVIREVLGR